MTSNGLPSHRIRVAHVVQQLNTGGMEKLLVEFARHADRRRFDLRFVSLAGRGSVADDLEAQGWPVSALGEPSGLRPGLVLRLARLFRQWRIGVVHTHNTRSLLYAAPAAWLARVPAVFHLRHGQRFGAGRRETTAFRLATRLVGRVVCVSEDSARLSAAEGVAPARLCVIHNGIDVARFAYRGPAAGGPAVMVGRLSPEKDAASLLRATALIARECPSFRLEIAGAGECLPGLRRLAGELGLHGRVRFLGEVRDIPGLLARASLFVLPSLTEGLSLTLLEAMARGLPVVATRVGGNPEVVVEGETGFLVPSRSPPELARALLRIQCDSQLGGRMGRAGRERVEKHFDVRRMVGDHEALYLRREGGPHGPAEYPGARPVPRAGQARATSADDGASSLCKVLQ